MIYKFISRKRILKLIKDFSGLGGISFYTFMIFLFYFLNRKDVSLQLIVLLIICSIIGYGIKLLYKKSRPLKKEVNNIKKTLADILDNIDSSSFPSIHSLRITLISLVMINLFSNVITLLFFIFLTLSVGISRVILKKHYFIDIIGGYLLGILSYYVIVFHVL